MDGHAKQLPVAAGSIGTRLIPLALFATFLAFYSLFPNNYPHWDELFHVLAGESWALDGTLETGNGPYTRTPLYTILVGELFKIFGPSLPVARLPAILTSALWITLTYLFVRAWAGTTVAVLAAIGMGLCPIVVEIAKMTRFYAVHGLFFGLGAFAFMYAVAGSPDPAAAVSMRRRAALLALAAGCLFCALYFQVTTFIGAFALLIWATCFLAVKRFGFSRRLLLVFGGFGAAGLTVLIGLVELGLMAQAIASLRKTAAWAEHLRHDHFYYYKVLLEHYPVLWPLFPLAAAYGFARQPVLTGFCATVFGVGLALQSLGGMKAERYIAYLMPFLWVVVAIAMAPVLTSLWRLIKEVAERVAAMALHPSGSNAARGLKIAVMAVALLGVGQFVVVSLAIPSTLDRLVHRVDYASPDWADVPSLVGLERSPQPVLLTRNPLHALYYFGDYHLALGPETSTAADQDELQNAARAGEARPTIATAFSLEKIVMCNPAGALLASEWHWRSQGGTSREIRLFAERHLDVHPAGHDFNIVLYTWQHEVTPTLDCPTWAVFDRPLRLKLRGTS